MSKKSTKIIAAAGVVAGLGVAALPAMTFASETVSGAVDLYAEVLPAIAMTIEGNNESNNASTANPYYGTGNGKVDVFNPAGIAGKELDGHQIPATATVWNSSSYTSILPNTVVNGNDSALPASGKPTGEGFMSTINVYTNNDLGYKLTVKATSASALGLTNANNVTIPPVTIESGESTGTLVAGTPAWGYKVGTASADGAGYSAITGSDVVIAGKKSKTGDPSATPATHGQETLVFYGVATAADQQTGVYHGNITYTATTFDSTSDPDYSNPVLEN
ncbi:hypothetical protein IKE88_00555 [Candidatus Saccharibacteria bacterium]|nr:hypothetical protein [Candidatus Saccharibacteria bacterium]